MTLFVQGSVDRTQLQNEWHPLPVISTTEIIHLNFSFATVCTINMSCLFV
jgi:hypothetical protein